MDDILKGKNIQQILDAIEREISGPNQEKEENAKRVENINNALEQMETTKQHLLGEQQKCSIEINRIQEKVRFATQEDKPIELREYEQDLEKIKNELDSLDVKAGEYHAQLLDISNRDEQIAQLTQETIESEKQSFLALVHEKDTNERSAEEVNGILEKMEATKKHLLEEQQQCRTEIDGIRAKTYFSADKDKPIELREYEADLEKITNELSSLNAKIEEYNTELEHITNRNEQIAQAIDETLEKYHTSIETETEKQRQEAEKRASEENLAWEEYNAEKEKIQIEAEARRPIEEDLAWKEFEKDKNDDEIIIETTEEKEAIEKWKNGEELESEEKTTMPKNGQKTRGGVTQPPKANPGKGTPVPPKPQIGRIDINEAKELMEVFDEKGKLKFARGIEQYFLEKRANDEFSDRVDASYEEIVEQIGEEKAELLDYRILTILEDMGTKEDIMQYAKSIAEKKEKMPFSINYNLKDIYKSGIYTLDGIQQINKWARIAKKQNRGKVSVNRDNIIKRAFGNLKLKKEKGMLPAPLKEIHPIAGTKEVFGKGKETFMKGTDAVVRGTKGVCHFTSKKLSNAMRHGKNLLDTTHIGAIRISGYFKGENPMVTEMKANQVRNKGFVPKARVDEKAAIKKVEASRVQAKDREVIIENPDGTKATGTRLGSIDDDKTK